MNQQTLDKQVIIEGIGLHSGLPSVLTIIPAPQDYGIVFKRVDLAHQPEIKALYSNVVDTKNCTCLASKQSPKDTVSTIEHLMSAFYILGIDNALVEINNPEVPIMDGSAKPFLEALSQVGIKKQEAKRKYLVIKKEVSFVDDNGNSVSIKPYNQGLKINFEIEFASKIVGYQSFCGEINPDVFLSDIVSCRTFCEKYQVDYLKSIGLIKGGSLENAVVLDGETVLNEGGLRHQKECVNHKVLDAIGDLYTAGYPIKGELFASKTGHFHNNELLKLLFSNKENYELV